MHKQPHLLKRQPLVVVLACGETALTGEFPGHRGEQAKPLAEKKESLRHALRRLDQRVRHLVHFDDTAQSWPELQSALLVHLHFMQFTTSLWIFSVSSTYFDLTPAIRSKSKLKNKLVPKFLTRNPPYPFVQVWLDFCSFLVGFSKLDDIP